MAIDSANKRAACLSFAQPNRARIWPIPDGSLANQADRQQIGWIYPGILVSAIVHVFRDLTTLFAGYVITLKTAHPNAIDVVTLIVIDLPVVTAAQPIVDLNTRYEQYLNG